MMTHQLVLPFNTTHNLLLIILFSVQIISLQSFYFDPNNQQPTTTTTTSLSSSSMHNNNTTTIMTPDNQHIDNNITPVATPPSVTSISEDDSSLSDSMMSMCSSTESSSPAASKYEELIIQPHTQHKKVLVTGGAGFIGSSVAEALLARGDDVIIVDEMNDYYDVAIKENNLQRLRQLYPNKQQLTIHKGDICNEQFMHNIFESERPEWVCHLAARAGVRPSIQDPFVYIHSNIRGTTHLMELSHKFGVKNFVFASSSSVYGGSKSTLFSEDESVDNPVSPYAASKKACELLAYTYHHLYKLNVSGLRFFTVYGPNGRIDMAPYKFVDRISRGEEMQKFGDGSSSRDYTYISDIVDGVIRSIDRPYSYQLFNLGKGNGTSLNEFISIVEKHVGKKAVIKQMPDQPGDVPYTCASVEKARVLLGYEASVSFDEGIQRTVGWYRNSRQEAEAVAMESKTPLRKTPSYADMARQHMLIIPR